MFELYYFWYLEELREKTKEEKEKIEYKKITELENRYEHEIFVG